MSMTSLTTTIGSTKLSNIHSIEEAYEHVAEALNYLEEHGQNVVGPEGSFDDSMILVIGEDSKIIWNRNAKAWQVSNE